MRAELVSEGEWENRYLYKNAAYNDSMLTYLGFSAMQHWLNKPTQTSSLKRGYCSSLKCQQLMSYVICYYYMIWLLLSMQSNPYEVRKKKRKQTLAE